MNSDNNPYLEFQSFFDDPNVRFPKQPKLVEDLSIFRMPDGLGIQFHGGPAGVVFRGQFADKALGYLLPALDGTRTIEELRKRCPVDVPEATLMKTLFLLHTNGLLVGGNLGTAELPMALENPGRLDNIAQRQLLFWGRNLGMSGYMDSAQAVQQKLESTQIVLLGTGLFGTSVYDVLTRSGCINIRVLDWDDTGFMVDAVRNGPVPARLAHHLGTTLIGAAVALIRDWAEDADLMVTATRNAPSELFRAVNRVCLDRNCPLLCANESADGVDIGPYVLPYASACYCCMELRRASTDDFIIESKLYQEHLSEERPSGTTAPLGESIASAAVASSLVALEVLRITTGIAGPTLLNGVLTFSVLNGRFDMNRILRVPRCPECCKGKATSSDSGVYHEFKPVQL